MKKFNRDIILNYLQSKVSEERFKHCLGVEKTAISLAPKFGVDTEAASTAALLHDVSRELSADLLLNLACKFDIFISDIEQAEPILLHGSVGAILAKTDLSIEDPSIIEAISFHITGGPNLTSLSHLIFIADFIEPGRKFERARILREEAEILEPDQILFRIYNETIAYVLNRGYLIHPNSIAGRNEILLKGVNL